VELALNRDCWSWRKVVLGNGIELSIEGVRIHLDPRHARGLSFISHAHSDHSPRSFSGVLIASVETCALMRRPVQGECWHRGMSYRGLSFTLHGSGHMPGSAQLLIENSSKILYTGDLCLEGGLISPPAETPSCDILILESTFGSPRYVFPSKRELAGVMLDWAEECNQKGLTPVVLAHALGKAQELTKLFSKRFTVYVDAAIHPFNQRTEALGIPLGSYRPVEEMKGDVDAVVLTPLARAEAYKGSQHQLALASGWAALGKGGRALNLSAAFPFSDHSDFPELVDFVNRVSPQVVYTVHGFASELSRHLRSEGFYSIPLSELQGKLDAF